jgi:hypothetical protein
LRNLYEAIDRSGHVNDMANLRGPIDTGIARIFHFVRDIAKIADLATVSAELVNLPQVIEVVLAAMRPEIGSGISFVKEAELPPVLAPNASEPLGALTHGFRFAS